MVASPVLGDRPERTRNSRGSNDLAEANFEFVYVPVASCLNRAGDVSPETRP